MRGTSTGRGSTGTVADLERRQQDLSDAAERAHAHLGLIHQVGWSKSLKLCSERKYQNKRKIPYSYQAVDKKGTNFFQCVDLECNQRAQQAAQSLQVFEFNVQQSLNPCDLCD